VAIDILPLRHRGSAGIETSLGLGRRNFHWTNESKRYKKKSQTKGPELRRRAGSWNESLMLNEERRRAILELVNRDGRVLVADLAHHFDTSQVTIRKDLELLHGQRQLHRTHGGALPARDRALDDPTLREKEQLHRKEKTLIAAAAARMVQKGQVVILDSGTTTTAIARALREFQNLTVITNAVNIAAELAGTSIEVILTGGTLRKNSFSLVGPMADDTLRHLSADLLFLAVDGFDVRYGLTTPNLLEAKVNRVMIEVAQRTVVVCDSSKFGRRSLSLIAPTSTIHEVISDRAIPKLDLRALKKAGIEVALV
jgi:DeoR family transcriptional regulator, aga operon transcriptional repressor